MTSSDCEKIHITAEVYDFMFIRVEDPVLAKDSLQYEMRTNQGELIRKGVFRGPVIQLRLSHLQDGAYSIILYDLAKNLLLVHSFEKCTPVQGEQTIFSF